MGQLGFFDIEQRYAALDAKDDPLAKLDRLIPWEQFRPQLEAVWRTPRAERKSPSGRTPWDAIVIFKGLLLGVLYNLSDEQIEYQIRDRLSFARFLGLGVEGGVPDATTFWLYREQLTRGGAIEELFETFDRYLASQGYQATGGQIVDASIVAGPKQRNTRRENEELKWCPHVLCQGPAPLIRDGRRGFRQPPTRDEEPPRRGTVRASAAWPG